MALCLVPKEFILSIGGEVGYNGRAVDTVECYDIKNDSWRYISDLNYARKKASSCLHSKNIYIFCGEGNSLYGFC